MTGLLHIVLARKPIEGTVAENCLQWGCGALWIDGTRVGISANDCGGFRTGAYTKKNDKRTSWEILENGETYRKNQHSLGRFPANLILGHCENCRRQGTKKVKGNAPVASGYDRLNKKQAELGYRPGEYQKGEVEPGYRHTDVGGKETVEVWDCEKNCATIGFPQAGSSRVRIEKNSGRSDESQYRIKPTPGTIKDFGDSGSASRFFFNFAEQESDE